MNRLVARPAIFGVAAAAGAAAALLAYAATGTAGALLASATVAGGACLVGRGQQAALRRRLSAASRAVESGDAEAAATGIAELDAFTASLEAALGRSRQEAEAAAAELGAFESLLARMDRRRTQAATGSEPPSRRMLRLLASLSRATGEDLRRIRASAEEIERRIRVALEGAGEQSEVVSETTTSVEQMSAHIDSISQNAEAAARSADAAREAAATGLALVQDLVRGINQLHLHVETNGKKLRALGDRSQEIGSIVETIADISGRTDLLALNASIESARAGEHGRGFALVAEEVRNLAEQTAQATREVAEIVESIQLEIQESVAAMREQRAQVDAEVRRVGEAGGALERISEVSSDSAQRVGDISRDTLHQVRLTQEVVLAMQRISEVACRTRSGAQEARRATENLRELADRLDESLSPLHSAAAGEREPGTRDGGPGRPQRATPRADEALSALRVLEREGAELAAASER